jgi:hypothetical protein
MVILTSSDVLEYHYWKLSKYNVAIAATTLGALHRQLVVLTANHLRSENAFN